MAFSVIQILFTFSSIILLIDAAKYIHYPEVKMSYKFHRNPVSWFSARTICQSEDATLAMPRNSEEIRVLKQVFDAFPSSTLQGIKYPEYIFLGFHDMFNEGEYITENGVAMQNYFHTWGGGQPDNSGNEDCGSMHRSGGLNDISCTIPGVYVCQKESPTDSDYRHLACFTPDPAYKYSKDLDKCYKLHLNAKTWADARTICHAEGGHLAIINSKKEEDFLVEMFKNPKDRVLYLTFKDFALLGFHDIYQENHFVTVEGEDLQDTGYVKWLSGQPDNAGGNENCGSIHISGGINDFPCSTPAVFFCEQKSNGIYSRLQNSIF